MSKKNHDVSGREALLAALSLKPVSAGIAGLPNLFVKELSALERVELIAANKGLESQEATEQFKTMVGLLPAVLVDADGAPVLSADDVDALLKGSVKLVDQLIARFMEVNGMSAKAAEEAKGN